MSVSGDELRQSLTAALELPSSARTAEMFDRIARALKKGVEVDGVFVNVETFGRLADILSIVPEQFPLPEIVVESEGQLGLDWDKGTRRVLSLTVDATPYIGFAALIGHEPVHGRVPFAGQFPETVAYLLSRLYPGAAASTRNA